MDDECSTRQLRLREAVSRDLESICQLSTALVEDWPSPRMFAEALEAADDLKLGVLLKQYSVPVIRAASDQIAVI